MAYQEALAMFAALSNNLPEDAVEEHTWAGLWDNATLMWATEREQTIGDAVRELSETLFRHEPAIGLLALFIVENRSRQTAVQLAWVHDFAAALKRVADDVVPVTVPPRPRRRSK